jgi:hypothetical protein
VKVLPLGASEESDPLRITSILCRHHAYINEPRLGVLNPSFDLNLSGAELPPLKLRSLSLIVPMLEKYQPKPESAVCC